MILSHEAQQALLLLARRKQNDPNCNYWGKSNSKTRKWICLACNAEFDFIIVTNYFTSFHGLECLKNHNMLAFI